MSVLRPRTRLVYFRMSEDEFQKAANMCQAEGARSLSDFARRAVQTLMEGSADPNEMLTERLRIVDELIHRLNQNLERLADLLQLHVAATEDRQNGTNHSG